jgi:hypothetical protein
MYTRTVSTATPFSSSSSSFSSMINGLQIFKQSRMNKEKKKFKQT